ncbi:MAG: carbonic anhydrase [Verrucomicrobia bacterium]|nr:MAG: carbonic anhydrase [Verrucomicrobiota bacterium]
MKKSVYCLFCILVSLISLKAEEVKSPFLRAKDKLEAIIAVNNEFVATRDLQDFQSYLETQTPAATIIMCSDSRVQPTSLHDDPKGRLFTIRNIGNQIDSNEGSVDYGVMVLKTPLLLILGHTGCGAVAAAMKENVEVPSTIKKELSTIDVGGAKDEKEAIVNNVNNQIKTALEKYSDLIKKKDLYVVGGIYDIHNIFGQGYGALIFVNVNGEVDSNAIRNSELFKEVKDLKVASRNSRNKE